ncbi:single-stranded-DNA-specific exonuclease RecJ [Porcipelethomonas sp.]|uniref:single-stranded-DNA-specific exonuclease RecJ n=1 Tax=Porcipelethomonas sp. TaxID=2981675 RepID=UPI003EF6B49D
MKKWIVRKPQKEYSEKILRESEVTPLCADILAARGFTSASNAAEQLNTDGLSDPFLLKDMREAAEIINEAVENFESICIYGDYDCDGITSTVILFSYLECMGANVMYYIPERSEGYGLNADAVKKLAGQGVNLIITVDNGISAIEESRLIYELGMKLVVTDHHQPGDELPTAEAIVNPHRKDCPSTFKYLCGAGIALKLVAALENGDYETALNEYGEFAAIGTVADVVSLTGENRFIVSRGLRLLENSERPGVNELIKKSGLKPPLTSNSIAFGLAPRINASGRFGSPSLAARLFLTDDDTEAEMLADELNKLNTERKNAENEIINTINSTINENSEILYDRVLVLSGENWHHGVIGIVASRIMERFDKPCFIITEEGEISRGSARSFGNFSIYKALDYCSDLLVKYGGHMGAGGFSIETSKIGEFKKRLQEYALENFEIMPVPDITAEKLILPEEITFNNIEGLKILEPYGEGNRQPVFAMCNTVVEDIIPLSKGLHTKLKIRYGRTCLEALIFRRSPDEIFIEKGDKADFMVTMEVQNFAGRKTISIIVKDYRKNGIEQKKYFAAKATYEKYKRKEELPEAYYARMCPDRNELVPVYKKLASGNFSTDTLYMTFASDNMNYCKLRLCLDIFSELGLVNIDYFSQEVRIIRNAPKADLDSSEILHDLRNKCRTKTTV